MLTLDSFNTFKLESWVESVVDQARGYSRQFRRSSDFLPSTKSMQAIALWRFSFPVVEWMIETPIERLIRHSYGVTTGCLTVFGYKHRFQKPELLVSGGWTLVTVLCANYLGVRLAQTPLAFLYLAIHDIAMGMFVDNHHGNPNIPNLELAISKEWEIETYAAHQPWKMRVFIFGEAVKCGVMIFAWQRKISLVNGISLGCLGGAAARIIAMQTIKKLSK